MYYQFPVFFGILPESDLLNIMRLQKGMILLGGSQTTPVPREDTAEAREEFQIYCNELKEKKIPIRYMTHATQHIPDDVDYFKVGVERLAAWVFETFQMFARNDVRQGNKVCEQIRNRLMERFLYLLPTRADGTIVTDEEMFKIEVASYEARNSDKAVVVDWKPGRGNNPTEKLVFPDYAISNKFPNDVLLMKDNSVVVCTNIIKKSNKVFQVKGLRFRKQDDAFPIPYISSRFNTHLVSKPETYDIWNINAIKGKMFACPFNPKHCTVNTPIPNIVTDKTTVWFVTPLRHTLNKQTE